jgi:hypothetical protein
MNCTNAMGGTRVRPARPLAINEQRMLRMVFGDKTKTGIMTKLKRTDETQRTCVQRHEHYIGVRMRTYNAVVGGPIVKVEVVSVVVNMVIQWLGAAAIQPTTCTSLAERPISQPCTSIAGQ